MVSPGVSSAPPEAGLCNIPAIVSIYATVYALGVQAFAEEGGRVALKGGFLEDTVLESSLRQVRYKGAKNDTGGGPQAGAK